MKVLVSIPTVEGHSGTHTIIPPYNAIKDYNQINMYFVCVWVGVR